MYGMRVHSVSRFDLFLLGGCRSDTQFHFFLTFSVFMVSFGFLCPRFFFSNGKIFFISIIISLFIRTATGFAVRIYFAFTISHSHSQRTSDHHRCRHRRHHHHRQSKIQWNGKRNTRKPVFIFHSTFYSGVACAMRIRFRPSFSFRFVVLLFRLLCALAIGINWIKA